MTEELVFRSCVVGISSSAGLSRSTIIFLTPLYFSIGASAGCRIFASLTALTSQTQRTCIMLGKAISKEDVRDLP